MNVCDLLQLPSVQLLEIKNLPTCPAIYFVMDSENRVIYIGQAANLAMRWKNHHRKFQLDEMDKICPIRIAWQVWNEADLNEAENFFIQTWQPLLNGTEVKSPTTIPSEFILREFLKAFYRRLLIIGIQPGTNKELPQVHLKYDWTDCSSKGTAALIKDFIQENKDKNTSLKFRRKRYGIILPPEVYRPGSREQKLYARQNLSYNNHWQLGCNGVIINIKPTHNYKELKTRSNSNKLAGIKLPAVTKEDFSEMSSKYSYEFSGLSCFERDPIPLLWSSKLPVP